MNINDVVAAARVDVIWVVFTNVLLQQLGIPVPAVPTLLVAGSLALSYGQFGQLLAVAVLTSVLADSLWYAAGRALRLSRPGWVVQVVAQPRLVRFLGRVALRALGRMVVGGREICTGLLYRVRRLPQHLDQSDH